MHQAVIRKAAVSFPIPPGRIRTSDPQIRSGPVAIPLDLRLPRGRLFYEDEGRRIELGPGSQVEKDTALMWDVVVEERETGCRDWHRHPPRRVLRMPDAVSNPRQNAK